ncbi:fungal-specific transcription factor domain-containing protein [Tricladium varicosporioides]|nr:fungal-specific transcription factor domain-containing protein [Hymenoscyphus varicosporioides]
MASTSCSSPSSVSTHRRAPRSKSGCLTCRRRKVRCNEQKPRCSHCERLNLECNWRPSPITSRPMRHTAPETSLREFESETNISSSSTSHVAFLQNSGQAVVNGPFNDTFNYASFMWDQDLQAMQPARWRDLGFPDMDVFASGDDMEDVASLNSSTFVLNGDSSNSQPFFSSQGNSIENQNTSVTLSIGGEVAKERILEQYFIQTVVPPIIAQVETQIKWSSMRQVLISMSTKSKMVHFAILAFSELLMGRNSQTRTPAYQKYYESAKAELPDQRVRRTMDAETFLIQLEYILATLFFLSYIDLLEGRIVNAHANLKEAYEVFQQADKAQLRMVSKRLVSWLRLLDGRAVSAGGEGLFLLENEDMLAHSSPASTDIVDEGNNEVEADIEDVLFDALYQPGFFFFQRTQSFMGRIAKIDPWHRSRGTVEDETEVMSIASKISRDLGTLWDTRPPLMDYTLNGKLTSSHISASLAFTITRTFRTYFANFNASRIHLHRVAYKHLPLSRETGQAISNIRNTARIMSESGTTPGSEQQMLPVNMLWPLLMWGCEENDLETREWIIVQINNMQQVATNAKITAQVLTEVQKRQDATKQRVDVRTVMHDIFNSCFAIV